MCPESSWIFIRALHRVSHRTETNCTADESWTRSAYSLSQARDLAQYCRYIVLNRNGSANELEITSRSFNPLVLFNEMKYVYPLSMRPCPHCSSDFRAIYRTLRLGPGFVNDRVATKYALLMISSWSSSSLTFASLHLVLLTGLKAH